MLLVSKLNTLCRDDSQPVYPEIISAWQQAAFSGVGDITLSRYLNDQLEGLAEIRDPLRQTELVALVDHLWQYYSAFLDSDKPVPAIYRTRLISQLRTPLAKVKLTCRDSSLLDFIAVIAEGNTVQQFSYRRLNYFASLIGALAVTEDFLTVCIQWNFNHLGYLVDCQHQLESQFLAIDPSAQREFLEQEKARIIALPERCATAYDPAWPSLKTMLVNWLIEKINLLPVTILAPQKLALNLSVAQLGCLVRAAFDEKIFKEENVTTILRFFSDHFSAKKQTDITHGGLSKAYYGIGQVTAAVVMDKLQQIYLRLKKNFFPA